YSPNRGGGSNKVFEPFDNSTRQALSSQIEEVLLNFQNLFQVDPETPVVAEVTLKEEALAKSHRPSEMLKINDCPVISVGDFGKLRISATQRSLEKLKQSVVSIATKKGIAN